MLAQLGHQLVDLRIQVCACLSRTRDDQWRAGLIDQDRVDLIDNCETQVTQHFVFQRKGQVIAQVVKAELVVCRVGDIAVVGLAFFVLRLATPGYPNRQAKEFVDRAHPVSIALREVLVDCYDMHAVAADRIEIGRQGCDERLAFTGAHLGDVAALQHHATNQLHVERAQTQRAPACFPGYGECLGQEVIQGFTARGALLEFIGLGAQRRIVESLQAFLERVDLVDGSAVLAQQSLVAAAENLGEKLGHGGSCNRN